MHAVNRFTRFVSNKKFMTYSQTRMALGLLVNISLVNLVYAGELPTGGNIVGGNGSISQNGSTMTITQATDKMAVNWQSFNIDTGHTVNFVQPTINSIALNRVINNDVSIIQGALTANGQVFLINPQGILFTSSAQINVGGLVASTLDINPTNFMAGNYKLEGFSPNAIVNSGNINSTKDIVLVAAKINNTGTIAAKNDLTLVTDDQGLTSTGIFSSEQGAINIEQRPEIEFVTVDMGGSVQLQIEKSGLKQSGAIETNDSSIIYLTPQAAVDLAALAINTTTHKPQLTNASNTTAQPQLTNASNTPAQPQLTAAIQTAQSNSLNNAGVNIAISSSSINREAVIAIDQGINLSEQINSNAITEKK